jgi:hypothetical protein
MLAYALPVLEESMKLRILLLAGVAAIGLSACGESVTSPDLVSSYKVSPTPGPSPCLLPGTLPAIDRPAPSPDPVTGQCPPPWVN